ncbi:hypothetical protein HPB47_016838 [Ixodes persulcatus]|uniref:Uncharacterized protein n=1 Tax=Ixodes persulcatus TaxID=34615 RepID=A0AC60QQW7_IXOPE|nr:hypothetical protein HPB47_016838 [Ixodes persulcatus]
MTKPTDEDRGSREGEVLHGWLPKATQDLPRKVDPGLAKFVGDHWGSEGRPERCKAATVCLEGETLRREAVAERLGATFSQMGRLFAMVTRERRECAIARVAPELRHMVAEDSGDEGSPKLFGESFLVKLKTCNDTLKALREAGQPSPPAEEPVAPRARNFATGLTSRKSHRQPFYTRGPSSYRGHRGRGTSWASWRRE